MAAVALLLIGVSTTTAEAAQKVTWVSSGKTHSCTLTSRAPTLASTSKYLTISATVSCTQSVTFTLFMRAVELEGIGTKTITEDPTNLMDIAGDYTVPGSVAAGKSVTLTYTIRRVCVNTPNDLTNFEEYATKALVRVAVNGTILTSAIDRTVPKLNSYAC
jgi:hypothetical protein